MPPLTQTTAPIPFRKTTETFTAGARTLPQCYFVSPEVFAEERKVIFSAQWACVGHQSQVARAGDYFVQEVAGESLIVVRDQRDEIRGFYNVCRHRGTRLCEDPTGHSSAIQCPYHAWTYALDGRLIGAPHMDNVPGFDKAEHSLHTVHLALWEGFIFVNLADTPTPLEKAFAALAGKFTHCRSCVRRNGSITTCEPTGS
jgi:Rieske 2Fe-2S family protein